MGYLNDKESWDKVPYFAEDAVLTGGPDCPDNVPIQALANRTAFLKQQAEQAARKAQPLSPDLSALAGIKGAGFYVSTGPGAAAARTLTAGQGLAISNADGKAGNPSVALSNSGVTPGNYSMVVVDAMGRVTSGRTMTAADVPALDWGKIASGKPSTLAGYGITDALSNAPATEAAAGILKIASQAQVNAGGNAGVAVTPKTLKFGFGCSLTQNGYLASPWWLGGWVFQWAVGTMTTVGDQEQNITFPIAFPNECIFLAVSTIAGSTALSDGWFQERTINRGWCSVVGQFIGGGSLSGGITPRIFAIGR
ncbi:gp53-like domain-containing protein [Chromobacterium rhizoryzae]|uniref:gp53-like domain-containing protein n=1 Tax=Chromobacterium rhizoryzae TaxID=1778675 RepID=UPI001D09951C|nr:hypothetical protein [Chromobacterium rhizoryzae]